MSKKIVKKDSVPPEEDGMYAEYFKSVREYSENMEEIR